MMDRTVNPWRVWLIVAWLALAATLGAALAVRP